MHLHLGSLINSNLWEKIDAMTAQSPEREHTTATNFQICKFGRLENRKLRKQPQTLDKRKGKRYPNAISWEKNALLWTNPDIVVLPANKGMRRNCSIRKKQKLIHIRYLPTRRYYATQHQQWKKYHKAIEKIKWEDHLVKRLQSSNAHSRSPHHFGLPKKHKPDRPLRPIMSAIDSPTYRLAKHPTTLLKLHVGNTKHQIQNSKYFSDILKKIDVKPSDIMVSFDV